MRKKSSINTIVLGLEHFIDKIGYQAQEYSKNDVSIKYLLVDKSGNSQYFSEKYNADIQIVASNPLKRFFQCIKTVKQLKPEYIELYKTGKLFLPYALLSYFTRTRLLVILRGHEFDNFNNFKH